MSATNIVCVRLCLSELMFLETSALTGENVEEAFVQCARKILNKIESGRDCTSMNFQSYSQKQRGSPSLTSSKPFYLKKQNSYSIASGDPNTYPNPHTSLSPYSSRFSFPGELDPERMGSGIQYGDAALRQLRSPRRTQAQGAQECGC